MQQFAATLYDKLDNLLRKISAGQHPLLSQTRECINACRDVISELKAYILSHSFTTTGEEIHFFKEIYPKFYRQFIYYVKIYAIETNLPAGSNHLQVKYFNEQLRKIKYFFYNNLELYQYYRTGSNHLDDSFYMRRKYDIHVLPDDLVLTIDPDFSTIQSYKLAKLQANEMLQLYINKRMADTANTADARSANNNQPALQWTGSKVALVELIYALKHGGVFNNATADIKQIISFFENVFHVEVNNYYNTFQEIRMRKKNRTVFLDQIKERLVQLMDEADENF